MTSRHVTTFGFATLEPHYDYPGFTNFPMLNEAPPSPPSRTANCWEAVKRCFTSYFLRPPLNPVLASYPPHTQLLSEEALRTLATANLLIGDGIYPYPISTVRTINFLGEHEIFGSDDGILPADEPTPNPKEESMDVAVGVGAPRARE